MKHFDTGVKFVLQKFYISFTTSLYSLIFLKHAFYIKTRIFQNLGLTSITWCISIALMKWNVPTEWFVMCIEHLIQNFIAQLNITRKGTCNL